MVSKLSLAASERSIYQLGCAERDANLSFIMARHIQNRLDYFVIPGESNPTLDLWRYHLDVASAHPEIVEWELVDNHFVTHPLLLVWASKSIISSVSLSSCNMNTLKLLLTG